MKCSKCGENVFKNELKQLLKKYNALIYFSVSDGSDTYGLYDERMNIEIDDKEIISVDGYSLSSNDIE